MGFTTFIQIVITDRIVFVPDTRAGVIAHRFEDCEVILRDKIKFAYEQLPAVIQAAVPIVTDNESELMLANGSSVRVSTSLRSATLQILHISEFGKICAKTRTRRGKSSPARCRRLSWAIWCLSSPPPKARRASFSGWCKKPRHCSSRGRT